MKSFSIAGAIVLLAIFFDIATLLLLSAGISLLWPGSPLDLIWQLNPGRHFLLAPYANLFAPLFFALAIPASAASYGFFARKPWARQLAIAIFAANGVGDAVQMALGHFWDGALGVTIVGLLLLFLTSKTAIAAFEPPASLSR